MKKVKNKQYEQFAFVYDSLMSKRKYSFWEKLIADVVSKYSISKGKALDLACGTGVISSFLISQGFMVTGLDLSKNMIAVAKRKKMSAKFIVSDIRNFSLASKDFVFATSFYDSLNYLLTDNDVLNTFKSVYAHLAPGGIFLFDINTRQHVLAAQKYKPRMSEGKGFYTIFRFSGEKRIWNLDIDLFIKQKKNYRLFQERHIERGYNKKDIKPILEEAGFNLILAKTEYTIYEDNIRRPSRLYFIAKKM